MAPATAARTRVIPVAQRTPEWLAARENGIGASQAAAACGLSPWQSRIGLWAEKLGLVPPDPENVPMRIGSALEPLIADLYSEATGTKVRRVNQLRQHPTHDWMLASIDRRAGRRPVELKYSHRGVGYGEPGTDQVPDHVLVQVLHELAVMDEDEADVAALLGGRRDVQIYTIKRQAAAERLIVEREAELWEHVQSRTEPPLDGSDATLEDLARIYDRDDGEVMEQLETDAGGRALLALRQVETNLAAVEARKKAIRAEIEALMGTASKLVVPGVGSVTWKNPKDSTVVAWEGIATSYRQTVDTLVRALRAHEPELALEGMDVSTDEGLEQVHAAVLSLFTTTKANSRRFGPARFEED
jgi:putative phage-type endonuclease